jgi:hypothetical protein
MRSFAEKIEDFPIPDRSAPALGDFGRESLPEAELRPGPGADPARLAGGRLIRMLDGQMTLLRSRVDSALAQQLTPGECEDRLNGAVADMKDWLIVVRERCQFAERSGDLPAGSIAAFDRLADHTFGTLSHGEWADPEWFRTTWRDLTDYYEEALSTALSSEGRVPPAGIRACEFQLNDLTQPVREAVAAFCLKRTIDGSLQMPQKGLEFEVTPEMLRSMTDHDSTVLWLLRKEGRPVAVFVLYLDGEPLSEGGRQIVGEWSDKSGIPLERIGYGELVVTDPDFSRDAKGSGAHLYREVMTPVLESARLFGLTHLVGEVRVGTQANLAMIDHHAIGWCETGLARVKNGVPLALVSMEVGESSSLLAESSVETSPHLEFIGNPIDVAALYRKRPQRNAAAKDAGAFTELVLKELGLDQQVKFTVREGLSGDKCCVSLFDSPCTQISIFQRRRNFDEWESHMCTRSEGQPVVATYKAVLTDALVSIARHQFGEFAAQRVLSRMREL